MKNYLKSTTLKSIRKGHLFCLNLAQPNGTILTAIYERGEWAGKIRFSEELSIRNDMYVALNPITGNKEMLISSSSEVWKI